MKKPDCKATEKTMAFDLEGFKSAIELLCDCAKSLPEDDYAIGKTEAYENVLAVIKENEGKCVEVSYKAMWEELKETFTANKAESERGGIALLRTKSVGLALSEVEIAFGYQMALDDMIKIEAKAQGLDEEED